MKIYTDRERILLDLPSEEESIKLIEQQFSFITNVSETTTTATSQDIGNSCGQCRSYPQSGGGSGCQ